MKVESNSFYCAIKRCRKTAWQTPEYLNDNDWVLLGKLVEALEADDRDSFDKLLYKKNNGLREGNDEIFFNRIIGWPEGIRYYFQSYYSGNESYFKGIQKHDLPRLKKVLDNRLTK